MKYWIFDFDGTLVDSEGYFSRSLNFALEPFDISVERNFLEKIRHKHPDQIFDEILTTKQSKLALSRLKKIGHEMAQEIKLFQGVEKTLETLRAADIKLAIWTGRDRASTEMILKLNKSTHYFDTIVTGTCVEKNKPGTDGLVSVLRHFETESHEAVMVGDHHHDIEPANHLGCTSVHARWKNNLLPLPESAQPDYFFTCTDQFHTWVQQSIS